MASWQEHVAAAGAAAARSCQAQRDAAPATAFCVAGSARTFATRVVLTHLRHNLIEALAGDTSSSRLFLHLKLNDSEKLAGLAGQKFHAHRENSVDGLLAALKLPWIQDRIGRALVVNGSGTAYGESECSSVPSTACVVQSRSDTWKRYQTAACLTQSPKVENKSAPCCAPRNNFVAAGNNEERLLLSHLAISWCGSAIAQYEVAHQKTFDLVVYTRPDAVWWQPVMPWCKWSWDTEMISCDGPACDMAWSVPRRLFGRFSQQHAMHRDCPSRPTTRSRHQCCTTSEHLLTFARTHHNATHTAPRHDQIRIAGGSSAVLRHLSVLRQTKGVCEVVLHPILSVLPGHKPPNSAGAFVFKNSQRNGLLPTTTVKLRSLFVRNESETSSVRVLLHAMHACHRALSSPGGTATLNATHERDLSWARWAAGLIGRHRGVVANASDHGWSQWDS